MLLRHKGLVVVLGLLLVTTALLSTHFFSAPDRTPAQWMESMKAVPEATCPDRLDWLAELDLTYPIVYARREIVVNRRSDLKRLALSRVSESLFPDVQSIDLTDVSAVNLKHCREPFVLDVPALPQDAGQASQIIFGISTTISRLEASIPQLVRWLPNTNARLFVIVIEAEGHDEVKAIAATAQKKAELQAHMRDLHMDVTLVEPLKLQESFSEKYFSLLKIMYDHRNGNTQWISTIDDDTFFPSIPSLVSMLKRYDPQELHYIGGVSEEWWAVVHYGLMGFGGAGIFISIALAKVMTDEYDHCKKATKANAGDIRIMECVYELTDIKLTNERDLHQIDIHGDLSGLFESGRMPLSLHHWKPGAATMEGYDLPMMSQVSDICQDCFLQRYQFDNDLILANGFSLARYPNNALKGAKMDRMEQTWAPVPSVEGSNNRGVDHSFGPTRPKLILNEEKIQYRLIHSAIVDNGVRQAYYHRGLDGDADTVFELFWRNAEKDPTRPLGK